MLCTKYVALFVCFISLEIIGGQFFANLRFPRLLAPRALKGKFKFNLASPIAEMEIGEGSYKQTVNLVVDTGSLSTWVMNKRCRDVIETTTSLDPLPKFDDSKITTNSIKSIFNESYVDTSFARGKWMRQNIKFKSVPSTSLMYMGTVDEVGNVARHAIKDSYSGIIGFAGYGQSASSEQPTPKAKSFVYNLASLASGNRKVGIYPKRLQTNNAEEACIIFGQLNMDLTMLNTRMVFESPLAYEDIVYWAATGYLKLDNARNTDWFPETRIIFLFDTGREAAIALPSYLYEILLRVIQSLVLNFKRESGGLVSWDCPNYNQQPLPMFIIKFPGQNVNNPGNFKLLNTDYTSTSGTSFTRCILNVYENAPLHGQDIAELGMVWFQKYFTGYDYDMDTVTLGFVNPNPPQLCQCCRISRKEALQKKTILRERVLQKNIYRGRGSSRKVLW